MKHCCDTIQREVTSWGAQVHLFNTHEAVLANTASLTGRAMQASPADQWHPGLIKPGYQPL